MSKTAKKIIAAAAVFLWQHFSPAAQEGDKELVVLVVHGDGTQNSLVVSTDAENLRGALEPEGIIAGDESEYGLFVKTVDGETVDESLQQWWCVTKGGESVTTGADATPIEDGDHFELTLTTGY